MVASLNSYIPTPDRSSASVRSRRALSSLPSLKNPTSTIPPRCSSKASKTSSQVSTSTPPTDWISSPSLKPARQAGSSSITVPTTRVVTVSTPRTPTSPTRSTTAKRKFIAGPAITMNARAPLLFERNSLSSPVTSPSGSSPDIFTYPPKGMALRRYSVSPLVNPTIFGPNPMENFSTLTPERFAARKCPISCTKISMLSVMPSPSTKSTMVISTSRPPRELSHHTGRLFSGPGIGLKHLFDILRLLDVVHRDHLT